MESLLIRRATAEDVDVLLSFSKDVFFTAFAHQNTAEDMALYAAKTFNRDGLLAELSNNHSQFYFAYYKNALAGYLKLNFNFAQTEFREDTGMEVERLYVHSNFQNLKIGQALFNLAIDTGRRLKKAYIWLGVWERNVNAIRFYERNGFTKIGEHDFMLGNDRQTDWLMKKQL
ncbi:GNAT family N-acetyltransferase [Mucilaginibacter sp. RS28]|uniref:GNAT family N-acetyltransferase n=1 Tax=Mucilaginibacter straminoryzae TaxID=2932774 RepID=A0A9X1X1Q0_9SPHI|nr:N-acetyltransferase [Mucilaginibacter straminoryzae]MCJ8209547.1 GNAT family N-acetyltransferase [Mucilaginibacter straminoryzae]